MGNKIPKPVIQTQELVDESVHKFITDTALQFHSDNIQEPTLIILRHLSKQNLIEPGTKIKLNQALTRLMFHQLFNKQLNKTFQLLSKNLKQWNQRSMNSIQVKQFETIFLITYFYLVLHNERLIKNIDFLQSQNNLHEDTHKLIHQLRDPPVKIADTVKIPVQLQQAIQDSIRTILESIIRMRTKNMTKSQTTLGYVTYLEQALFMLYLKMYFGRKDKQAKIQQQSLKSKIEIGAYMIAAGASRIKKSLYQSGVIFVFSVLMHSSLLVPAKAIKSHLFHNLPMIPSTSIYDYIACIVLDTLKYIYEKGVPYIKFVFNRIMSIRMIKQLLKLHPTTDSLVVYYLEQLCGQVKISQIERAFVYDLVEMFMKKNDVSSPIMEKFLKTRKLNYNIKLKGKQIKLSPEEVLIQFEKEENMLDEEYEVNSEMFIYECILNKKDHQCVYNDVILWQKILPKSANEMELVEKQEGLESIVKVNVSQQLQQ